MLLCRLYQTTEPCFELVKRYDQRFSANSSEGFLISLKISSIL